MNLPINKKASFNLSKIAGPRRIKDRGIKWEERYHDRSAPLKKKFEKIIGPGIYYRWEGHDYTTDSDYFVVVGPAVTKEGKKKFFAGIKKIPKDTKKKIFAPDGEYFSNIMGALSHANDKWAVPVPKGQVNYGEAVLAPHEIPRHMKG